MKRPLILMLFVMLSTAHAELQLDTISLPPGFKIEVFAPDVPGARSMARGSRGTLFVGTRDEGKVYAVIDADHDFRAERVLTLAGGKLMPNGVAFRDGALYVAEINRVWRFPDIENRLDNPGPPETLNDTFPSDRQHGWKFIRFGPDGKLYIPVGAPCNVCERRDARYATIMRMEPDGSNLEIFSHGVRNTVGFDWHPQSEVLWFTDNGRDRLGDDMPPDELNRAPIKSLHFGFPFVHGKRILDPKYGKGKAASDFTAPAIELGPHTASLGMRFYTGEMFPAAYRNQIFIAEHGSWNRSKKTGYRIGLVRVDNHHAVSYEVFAEGWLRGEEAWGRPVDIEILPDGSMLLSDDKAGAIYRISYTR